MKTHRSKKKKNRKTRGACKVCSQFHSLPSHCISFILLCCFKYFHGLNCVPPSKRYIIALTPGVSECDLIWKQGCCWCTQFRWGHYGVVVQSLSRVRFFLTPWTAARQASLSVTISWSWLKFMSIELMMPSNHLILCYPLLFLPSIFPGLFQWISSLQQVAKVLELKLQHQSFQWILRGLET